MPEQGPPEPQRDLLFDDESAHHEIDGSDALARPEAVPAPEHSFVDPIEVNDANADLGGGIPRHREESKPRGAERVPAEPDPYLEAVAANEARIHEELRKPRGDVAERAASDPKLHGADKVRAARQALERFDEDRKAS